MRHVDRLLLRFVRRWVAGESVEDAIHKASEANRLGIGGMLNFLGEHTSTIGEADAVKNEYSSMLRIIDQAGLNCSVSLKPSQVGLDVDFNLCLENLEAVMSEADARGRFVWIDMEGSKYTQRTLDLYLSLLKRFEGVGVAIQAYLKRSEGDVDRLLKNGGKIRLCKGAYNEPADIAFKSKREVSSNFSRLMGMLFRGGGFFAIATHDDLLLKEAVGLSRDNPARFEFQMLMGVRNDLKLRLAEAGFNVREYIPYGRNWLPYAIRRIRERKSNIILLARSLFQ